MAPLPEPVASRALTTFIESWSATSPKTTWRPLSHEVSTVVTKNWEPLRRGGGRQNRPGRASDCVLLNLRVGTSVGHGQEAGLGVLELEVLVGELLSVDGLATSAVTTGEVTTLEHEVGDDAVERGALVAEALLAGAESAEVLGGLGDNVTEEVEVDAARLLCDMTFVSIGELLKPELPKRGKRGAGHNGREGQWRVPLGVSFNELPRCAKIEAIDGVAKLGE